MPSLVKSPLRYPGGKNRAVKSIARLLPRFKEYREPFLGGGSVFFYVRQRYPDIKFWINDIYADLAVFWREAQRDVDAVAAIVSQWKNDFCSGRELYAFLNENFERFGDTERAAAFFVYNRITFSGTTLSGGYSEQAFALRFTDSSIERLRASGRLLDCARITDCDYAESVEAAGENVFIFLDPPYYSASKSALYGRNGALHKRFDHVRFAETMRRCSHDWLLTYDDSPYIRELFAFANIIPWQLSYGMKNVGADSVQHGAELLISNYLTPERFAEAMAGQGQLFVP